VEYLQWSAACEKSVVFANQHLHTLDHKAYTGRGTLPKFKMKSEADKSSQKTIDHATWKLSREHARFGTDLYSSLWFSLAGIFETVASAQKLDKIETEKCATENIDKSDDKEFFDKVCWKNRFKVQKLFHSFFDFLLTRDGILDASLKKLGHVNQRWIWILQFVLHRKPEEVRCWAKEARKNGFALSHLAQQEAKQRFHEKIDESLKAGDAWLHKWSKDNPSISPTIEIKGDPQNNISHHYITDPHEILDRHGKVWGEHWQVGRGAKQDDVIKAIREAIEQVGARNDPLIFYTPQQIRIAARAFKTSTAIGCDSWALREIALMPDAVLYSLGELLSGIQNSAIPPLQMMCNIMATLPKKDGGTRTVAIASTLYRLLMQLDNDSMQEFENRVAYSKDSAKAGASAVDAAEDRALEAEIAAASGKQTIVLLWDIKKFFDSIDIPILFEKARQMGFPLRQLLLSVIVHQSPRRLKLGKAIGEAIMHFGRSIIAGCKRSTQLARLYTVSAVKQLASLHPGVSLYQHVDDISNLVVDETKQGVLVKALKLSSEFSVLVKGLKLDISNKSCAVPENDTTRKLARILTQSGIPIKTARAGVDIGVDTAAGVRRSTAKQAERIKNTSKTSARVKMLSRINNKVKRLAVTGVKPMQNYAYTAIGMAPESMDRCKRNIATATGLVAPGACATTAIRWAFKDGKYNNQSADPRVDMPLGQIRSWMRI
jgi:hypothetical protein